MLHFKGKIEWEYLLLPVAVFIFVVVVVFALVYAVVKVAINAYDHYKDHIK